MIYKNAWESMAGTFPIGSDLFLYGLINKTQHACILQNHRTKTHLPFRHIFNTVGC